MSVRARSPTRPLLSEGWCLLTYTWGRRPSVFAVRRWIRALPAPAGSLALPAVLLACPPLLRLVEPLPVLARGPRAAEFTRRLYLAMVLVEKSGGTALPRWQHQPSLARVLLESAIVGAGEAALLLPRLLVHLLWWQRRN